MNAAVVLLVALLPGATVLPPPASSYPPAADASAGECVAPAGMTALLDQDPTDEQVPWRRSGAGKVPVYFAVGGMPADWRGDMEYGSAQWNKSPCVDTRVVDTCPTGSNCVTVSVVGKGDDGNFDAVEKGGYTTGGHIDLLNSLSADERKNVAVHEMGHAIGLKHRKTARVLMNGDTYSDVFDPDQTDHQNLLFAYGRQQPAPFDQPPALAAAASNPTSVGATGNTYWPAAAGGASAAGAGSHTSPASAAALNSTGLPPEVLAAIQSLSGGYAPSGSGGYAPSGADSTGGAETGEHGIDNGGSANDDDGDEDD